MLLWESCPTKIEDVIDILAKELPSGLKMEPVKLDIPSELTQMPYYIWRRVILADLNMCPHPSRSAQFGGARPVRSTDGSLPSLCTAITAAVHQAPVGARMEGAAADSIQDGVKRNIRNRELPP